MTGSHFSCGSYRQMAGTAIRDKTRPFFLPVVIVPTYNNARTLAKILRRIERLRLPVIVVNDGSTDGTARIVTEWLNSAGLPPASKTEVTHLNNRGKAAALQTGFTTALEAGYTHAATIDSDGQLDPEQIPDLLRVAQSHPEDLVIGVRDAGRPDYPIRSRWGRDLSNYLIRLECGKRITDSQCGLRVYPLAVIRSLRCRARRYGYETEIITRMGWAGGEIQEVPVSCRYFQPGERVSHFRPCLDSARSAAMHMRLLLISQTRPRTAAGDAAASASFAMPASGRLTGLWQRLRRDDQNSRRLALSLACGVFIGNQPVYGLQTIVSVGTARLFKLNPLAVVLGSFISTPPLSIPLIAMAVAAGHLLLHGAMPSGADFDAIHRRLAATAGRTALDWVVGAPVVGGLLSACTFFVVTGLSRFSRQRGCPEKSDTAGEDPYVMKTPTPE